MATEKPPRANLLLGTLDMLILRTLVWGPAHGHQIGKHIQRSTDDFLQMQHGSLYPALHRLERKRWIVSKWETAPDRNREFKYYRLTECLWPWRHACCPPAGQRPSIPCRYCGLSEAAHSLLAAKERDDAGRWRQKHQTPIRFKVGTHGGCEASQFASRKENLSKPQIEKIAAAEFNDALACLRWHEPGFLIDKVENQEIILLISESPFDCSSIMSISNP